MLQQRLLAPLPTRQLSVLLAGPKEVDLLSKISARSLETSTLSQTALREEKANSPRAGLSPADAPLALVLPQLPSLSPPQTEVHVYGELVKNCFSDPSRAARHRSNQPTDSSLKPGWFLARCPRTPEAAAELKSTSRRQRCQCCSALEKEFQTPLPGCSGCHHRKPSGVSTQHFTFHSTLHLL